MPKTRDSFLLTAYTLPELVQQLTFLFQRLSDRMDRIEGIRGTAAIESNLEMNQNLITEVGGGSVDDDAARLADLTQQVNLAIDALKASSAVIGGAWTFSADTSFEGKVKVFDANGVLIHSLE